MRIHHTYNICIPIPLFYLVSSLQLSSDPKTRIKKATRARREGFGGLVVLSLFVQLHSPHPIPFIHNRYILFCFSFLTLLSHPNQNDFESIQLYCLELHYRRWVKGREHTKRPGPAGKAVKERTSGFLLELALFGLKWIGMAGLHKRKKIYICICKQKQGLGTDNVGEFRCPVS